MDEKQPKIRIALADDHTMFRKGVVALLSSAGDMEVVAEAPDGGAFLEALEQLATRPDVCILDVNMPRMNGYETLERLLVRYPKTPVLILTMLDHEGLVLRMVRAGARGFVLKEEEPEVLLDAVREVAAGKYFNGGQAGTALHRAVRQEHLYKHTILTERETEFLKLTVSDMTYKEIAEQMGISQRTVENYRDAVYRRLDLNSRIGLAMAALRLGLVNL
jgi:two-component system invasion response regulator UvrY